MTSDNLVSWAFTYVLVGAVVWMLIFSSGLMDKRFEESRSRAITASIGVVLGWWIFVGAFVLGFCHGLMRGRKVRQ